MTIPPRMYTKTEKITPEMASDFLQRNQNNRTISDAKVQEWKRAMERGEWQLTHQGIAIDTNGNIIDGQHRLWAIVYADKVIEMMVTYNAPPETKSVIDVGRKRTTADVLTMAGEVQSTALAGCIRILDGYWRGFDVQRKEPLSHQQTLQLLEMNPVVRAAVNDGRQVLSRTGLTVSPASAGCALIMMDPDYSAWMDGITKSQGIYEKDPRIALKNAMVNALRTRRKRTPEWQLALFGKAWLAFKQRRGYSNLAWKDTEPMPMFGEMKHWAPARD